MSQKHQQATSPLAARTNWRQLSQVLHTGRRRLFVGVGSSWLWGQCSTFRLIDDRCPEDGTISLRTPLALLLISLGTIAAVWWWLAIPIDLARAPIDPNAKLQCISYAPFRDHQTSLSPATQVSREQIAEDLAQLAKITDCVRTYAVDLGLDQIPELAARVGLKVIQGGSAGIGRRT